jgi:hypothetical protein
MWHFHLRVWGALAVVAGAWSLCVTTAAAQAPGVHVDPGSPAAKEYSLLLPQARGGGRSGSGGSTGGEPLFGAGLRPAPSDSARPRHGASPGGSPPAGSHGATTRVSPPALPAQVVQATRNVPAHDGTSAVAALIGGGVAVLVLSVLGGTVFRRSRRSTPPV